VKYLLTILFGIVMIFSAFLVSSCQRQNKVCPTPVGTPHTKPALADLINLPPPDGNSSLPITVEIGGKLIEVDKLVDYPLCNDSWEGVVYVGCDAQVAEADSDEEKNPLFFKGCDLDIAPNTVVYVAAHNDTAYYKGCSCHTGEDPVP